MKQLGDGTYSVVKETADGYAVKKIDRDHVESAIREILIVDSINSKNVIKYHRREIVTDFSIKNVKLYMRGILSKLNFIQHG